MAYIKNIWYLINNKYCNKCITSKNSNSILSKSRNLKDIIYCFINKNAPNNKYIYKTIKYSSLLHLFILKETIKESLPNASMYFPIIDKKLRSHSLPTELKYLTIIESNLNPKALSKVGASGIWQITKNTAKRYNLIVNNNINERENVTLSTNAICRLFLDITKKFGSNNFLEIITSYKLGPRKVKDLYDKKGNIILSKSLLKYISKFIAIYYIINYNNLPDVKKDNIPFNMNILYLKNVNIIKNDKIFNRINYKNIHFLTPKFNSTKK